MGARRAHLQLPSGRGHHRLRRLRRLLVLLTPLVVHALRPGLVPLVLVVHALRPGLVPLVGHLGLEPVAPQGWVAGRARLRGTRCVLHERE